jgi:tetraacyldisaccharide 4'-kinase
MLKKKNSVERNFNIPVICVGNIYIGGTGKTPLSIEIANQLNKLKKTAIIKKYYKEHKDEHELINAKTNCLILDANRSLAIEKAKKNGYKIAILDDGFQDHSIKRDLNILCFNSNQLIGNGYTFPSGPLREKLESIKRADIVIINGRKNKIFEETIINISRDINIFYSEYVALNIKQFKNKKICAFAGIGNPENFFKTLSDNNIHLKKTFSFPDHYEFSKTEIANIINYSKKESLELITTEKDYYRIRNFGFKNIKYLKIDLKILKKEKFFHQIMSTVQ